MLQKEDKFTSGPACCCLFVMWSIWLQKHKKVKMYIISIARRAVKELSETNIILQDRYYGHLAHFQYTSFWKLKKFFFHSTLLYRSLLTCDISHAKNHLWEIIHENSREISQMKFHMRSACHVWYNWYFRCVRSHVKKSHGERNHTWNMCAESGFGTSLVIHMWHFLYFWTNERSIEFRIRLVLHYTLVLIKCCSRG